MLAAAVDAEGWADEVVVGLRSVLVVPDPADMPMAEAAVALAGLAPASSPAVDPRDVRIPVTFDGPDTDEVCAAAGVDAAGLADMLTDAVLEVAVVGFSPGFPYLSGLPDPLHRVPRRERPRTVVPAGSVAVAGGLAGIYPQATPGGWQLVGRTDLRLFDPATPPFALLTPGDRVRFVRATVDAPEQVAEPSGQVAGSPGQLPGSTRRPLFPPPGVDVALVVDRPGLYTVVQDGGRRGLAKMGVPPAGPADPLAHGLANRLVGNHDGAAALEITATGPVLRSAAAGYLSVVGGRPDVVVDGHPVAVGHVVPVAAGQTVEVRLVRDGLRSYLAWAGGLVVPAAVGSRSTDQLTGIGVGPLLPGDRLGVGPATGSLRDHLAADPPGDHSVLRVLGGPHPEWFPATALDDLAAEPLVVDGSSDRVGLRLVPAAPIRRKAGELDSQGMVTGAVQVPPDGRPVVLGPDHATLGGYPVVAVVITADLWKVGQCRPGDRVRLVPVTGDDAAAALADFRRVLSSGPIGRYPVVAG